MKIAFLLGSGISIPAKMPCTAQITQQVLSGEGFRSRVSGRYERGEPAQTDCNEILARVLIFLNWLKTEMDLYYCNSKVGQFANYEHIYYVTEQIHDSEARLVDNYAVQPLVESVKSRMQPILKTTEDDRIVKNWDVTKLTHESRHYIRDVICDLLQAEKRVSTTCDASKTRAATPTWRASI